VDDFPQPIQVKQAANIEQGKNMTEKLNSQLKNPGRLVLVTGDKGGTGKSVVARILLDVYRHRSTNCLAYECDQSNPQLHRHYDKVIPGVKTLKLNQRGGADALQNDLKQFNPQVSLVDMPAGAAEYFENIAKDIFLFENAQRLGYRITMVSVLSRVKESLSQLQRLVDFCGDRVDYVIIKNLYWGEEHKFTRYNNSQIRQTVTEKGAVELMLPELFDDIFDLIDSNDLTFREALEHDAFTFSNQSRVFGWIQACEAEFRRAGVQLGIE
jgi:energy-coupling factor transporter ATP-binding protein EcfA2